jgi:hypothetical protein
MVYTMKSEDGKLQVEHDRHIMGIFPRQTWLDLLSHAGLQSEVIPFDHSQIEPGTCEVFLARKITS